MRLPAWLASCSGLPPVPDHHTELSQEQLRELFDMSLALNGGRLIVHGIIARADAENFNRRIYKKAVLKREVAKFDEAHVKNGTALGELDHPNYASCYFRSLNLPNISHQVLAMRWRGNELWGTLEVLKTPSGLLLWELYSQGVRLGVSSRGWASLLPDAATGCVIVGDDFELVTFDFVTEPSTPGAYLVPITRRHRGTVPLQTAATQMAFLGHGVVSMSALGRRGEGLPAVADVAARLQVLRMLDLHAKMLEDSGAGGAGTCNCDGSRGGAYALPCSGTTTPAAAAASLTLDDVAAPRRRGDSKRCAEPASPLDAMLLRSHYVTFQDASYLEREPHVRNFHMHLALFAMRAHRRHASQTVHRAVLYTLIMQEIAFNQDADEDNIEDLEARYASTKMQPSPSITNFRVLDDGDSEEPGSSPPPAPPGPAALLLHLDSAAAAPQKQQSLQAPPGARRTTSWQHWDADARAHTVGGCAPAAAAATAATAATAGAADAPDWLRCHAAEVPAMQKCGSPSGRPPRPAALTEPASLPASRPSAALTEPAALPASRPSAALTEPAASPASRPSDALTEPAALPASRPSAALTEPAASPASRPSAALRACSSGGGGGGKASGSDGGGWDDSREQQRLRRLRRAATGPLRPSLFRPTSGRVHPTRLPSPLEPSPEVHLQIATLRVTLNSYASMYHAQQSSLLKHLSTSMPVVADRLALSLPSCSFVGRSCEAAWQTRV